jgi:hypothetical protein
MYGFPRIQHPLTKYLYIYLFAVGMIFQHYMFQRQYYWLWALVVLSGIGYIFVGQNKEVVGGQNEDFQVLEAKMAVLIPPDLHLANYLYVEPEMLDFLYDIRAFRQMDPKNFGEVILRVNAFLRLSEQLSETRAATSADLEQLTLLKKEALNYFHSMVYSVRRPAEMKRHNELRYILEEKLQKIYFAALAHGKEGIRLQEFGYDARKSTFDLY